jgi:hypothetical protein
MSHTIAAWGVFRDGLLISSLKGQPEKDAKEQAVKLNSFNGMNAQYIAGEIRGQRLSTN